MNKFLKEFKDRGFFYQCSNESGLSELLNKKKSRHTSVSIALLKAFILEVYFK